MGREPSSTGKTAKIRDAIYEAEKIRNEKCFCMHEVHKEILEKNPEEGSNIPESMVSGFLSHQTGAYLIRLSTKGTCDYQKNPHYFYRINHTPEQYTPTIKEIKSTKVKEEYERIYGKTKDTTELDNSIDILNLERQRLENKLDGIKHAIEVLTKCTKEAKEVS